MSIQNFTKSFLEASGWTQARLAKAINVHVTSLNRYLHSHFKPSTGEKLAEFLLRQSGVKVSFDEHEKEQQS